MGAKLLTPVPSAGVGVGSGEQLVSSSIETSRHRIIFSSLFMVQLHYSNLKLPLKPDQSIGQDKYAHSDKHYTASNIDYAGITIYLS